MFFRCKNNGRKDGKQNPEGDLALGQDQPDTVGRHAHSYDGAIGQHLFQGGSIAGVMIWPPRALRTTKEGGDETRPRNITVNAFVKVRESAPAHHQTQISAEWVAQLFQSAEFLRALREAVTATFRSLM